MFETEVVVKIKTHISYSLTPPPFENHAGYEIMCKNNYRAGQATDDNMGHTHSTLYT